MGGSIIKIAFRKRAATAPGYFHAGGHFAVVKALSNGKVGPRQCTLPTYLPKVDVPRPPPPTYVGGQGPRWGGGGGPPSRPKVQGGVWTGDLKVPPCRVP